jgi:hypothetical protein
LLGGGVLNGTVNATGNTPGSIVQGGDAPGTITVNGTGSSLGPDVTFQVNIDGNIGYSQLALGASGTLNLNGAPLNINFNDFVPYPGDSFTIVSNNAAKAGITGAFGMASVNEQTAISATDGATVGTVSIGGTAVPVEIFYPGSTAGATALGVTTLTDVVLYVQGPIVSGGPSAPIAVSGVLTADAQYTGVTFNGAAGYTQYYVPSGDALNLGGAQLTAQDLAGAISYGTYTIVSDQSGRSYNNSGGNSYAISGEFTDSTGASLAPGAAISVAGTDGNTYVLRIFYPQDDFNADGSLLKDVVLERQTPLQILGSDQPGSSGTSYAGILLNASYPQHTWTVQGSSSGTYYGQTLTFDAYQDPGAIDYNNVFNTGSHSTATAIFEPGLERSMITQITLTFTGIVDSVDQGAITLQMQSPFSESVPLTYSSTPVRVGDRSVLTINFLADSTPTSSTGGPTTYVRPYDGVVALVNGNYQLEVSGASSGSTIIHSVGNNGLALAANKVDNFYALYGDIYGQGRVTGYDSGWESLENRHAPTDELQHDLSYFTNTANGAYLFGALADTTMQQYKSESFLPGFKSSGALAGWDPDVVYSDQDGIGYIDSIDNTASTVARGQTLPYPFMNNPFV